MPKSKRSKLVSLTKVAKKTREHKNTLLTEIQQNAEKWRYCWLLEVGNMRNTHLKTVRNLWKGSARIFFGRGAVMAKALGTTPEEEHRPGIHKLAKQIQGQVGLLFTDTEPQEVIEWFAYFQQPEFARAGNISPRTITLPAGPLMRVHSDPPEPFPHSEEPHLRKLGLAVRMERGVPTLEVEHRVCEKGEKLTAEQAGVLKLVGHRVVVFRVVLRARWDGVSEEVVEVEGGESREGEPAQVVEEEEGDEQGDGGGDDDEEMDE